jgi:hypothetical protein
MAESQKLTSVFLTGKGRMRLIKAFKKDGTVDSYPRAKNFTSHLRTYDLTNAGMQKRVTDLKDFADRGGCLLKGELQKQLEEESRSGHSLKNKRNRTLLLDIDKFPINRAEILGLEHAVAEDKKAIGTAKNALRFIDKAKGSIGKNELQCLAEHVLSLFPFEEMQNTSYVIHTSSSMGVRTNEEISMHIEFVLSAPVSPEVQTTWLQCMNYYIDHFSKQLQLSANGLTLKFPLDVSVTSNAKLIFIAHPYFEEVGKNPIQNEHRIMRIEKSSLLLDTSVLNIAQRRDAILERKEGFIKALRKSLGLPAKKAKTTTISLGGRSEEFLKNPDGMDFEIVNEEGDFVHVNVNGGDSNAYWFPKNDPTLVYNFKDEPIFRLEDASAIFYEECLRRFAEDINAKKGGRQLIRRVREKGGAFVCVEIDKSDRIHETMETKDKQAATDWGIQYGIVLPDNVSFASLQYNPQLTTAFSVEIREGLPPIETINTFIYPESLRLAEKRQNLEVEPEKLLDLMKEHCPASLRLISHVLADKTHDVAHFINWLGVAATTRKKTGTTWLMQGVQGTGKGIMWEHIIQPIFGKSNTKKITIDELEDKFNDNMRTTTMILVDEFRHSDAAGSKKLENKLKLMATEASYSMRAMHSEYAEKENYFNMIFFSNSRDAMRVESSDRRINVGTRQESRLEMTLGAGNYEKGSLAVKQLVLKVIEEKEVFANIVMSANFCDVLARQALNNEAKTHMRNASSTRMEDFSNMLAEGRLNGFLYAMQEAPDTMPEIRNELQKIAANFQAQSWGEHNQKVFLTSKQLCAVYSVYCDKVGTPAALKKYLERHVSKNLVASTQQGKNWGYNVQMPYTKDNQLAFAEFIRTWPLQSGNISNIGN